MSPALALVLDVVLSIAIGLLTSLAVALRLRLKKLARRELATLSALAAIIVCVVAFAVLWHWLNPPLVTVPDVVGSWRDAATAELKRDFRAQQKLDSSAIEEGKITRQQPLGGTRVRWKTTVTVWVGTPVVREVPDVVGLWRDVAIARLKVYFHPAVTYSASDFEAGKVYRQTPRGGALCRESAPVQIWVSSQDSGTRLSFAVLSPHDGDTVGSVVAVSGTTPYEGLNHYIVVRPDKGTASIEGDFVTVKPGGSWECRMAFASPNAGIGQQFELWCLATHKVLQKGMLPAEPEDSKRSGSVTVTREE